MVSIPLPRIFGRLLLLKLLARGGMGDVYLAATTGIEGAERPIVVKTVRRDHIHDGSFLARFLDEARVQSQLNHPGVAQILEASTDENGEPYTVVEYVEGRSLADVRHRTVQVGARIGWPEACALAIEMGMALSHVHERAGADGTPLGIVHRDLSPQNVMVGYAGEVKLIDFGTARGHNRRCHTVAGVVFAKPGYVAPEVARQQVGDGRIDVYAIGVMLWELCAGKRLLTGEAQKHLEDVAAGRFEIPLLASTRGIPRELDNIIQKLCANDPDDRYASASHAATDLARVLAQAPAGKSGERSVRARVGVLMKTLWPHEPARSRAEFAKLLKQARELRKEPETPPASGIMEIHAAHMTQDPSILAGTPYRMLRKIGEGASGEVFEAEHIELGRRYAVKVLTSAHAAAHDAVDRFRKEARAVAKLSHPNLVQLHDFGKSIDGRVFLVMELLEGQTLDVHAEKGLGWRESVRPRHPGDARARGRAPGRRRSSRPQAPEPLPHDRGRPQAARLRRRDGARRHRRRRAQAEGLRRLRYARVHGARAGRRRDRRRALRHLRARLRSLRARHRHASVRGLAGRRDGQAAPRGARASAQPRAERHHPGRARGRHHEGARRRRRKTASRPRSRSARRSKRRSQRRTAASRARVASSARRSSRRWR